MKSGENIDAQRINRALAVLRQKIEEVERVLESASAPKLAAIKNLGEIPKGKREVVENQLWFIFAYGEYYVKKLMSDFPEPMLSVKGKERSHFYGKEYKPLAKKIRELIDVSNAPTRKEMEMTIVRVNENYPIDERLILQSDINKSLDHYEYLIQNGWFQKYIKMQVDFFKKVNFLEFGDDSKTNHPPSDKNDSIKSSFECFLPIAHNFITDLTEEDFDSMGLNLSDCDNIIKKPYFNPDDWMANEEDLSLFVTSEEVPPHVKARIKEIYRSFIFGNWMSVIALSRCLLEYSIIDFLTKKIDGKSEIYDDKGYTKPLAELIQTASKAAPKLEDSMRQVKNIGNEIMHPPSDSYHDRDKITDFKKVRALVPPGKDKAENCIEEISKIIGTLYSA